MTYNTIFGDVYYGNHASKRGVRTYLRRYVLTRAFWIFATLTNVGFGAYIAYLSWTM